MTVKECVEKIECNNAFIVNLPDNGTTSIIDTINHQNDIVTKYIYDDDDDILWMYVE